MSSTRRTEIFIAILTLGLGTLVHFGKCHMFSASLVELKAEQEQIFLKIRNSKKKLFKIRTITFHKLMNV